MKYISGLDINVGRAWEFYTEMGADRPTYDDNEWLSSNGEEFRRLNAKDEDDAIFKAKEDFYRDQHTANIYICDAIHERDKLIAEQLIKGYWEHWPEINDRGFWGLEVIENYPLWDIFWVEPLTAFVEYMPLHYVFRCSINELDDTTDFKLISPTESESPDIRETQFFTATNLIPMAHQVFIVKMTAVGPPSLQEARLRATRPD